MKRSAPEHGRAKQRLLFRVCGSDGFQDRESRTGERGGINMVKRKTFKSIEIDTEKGVYKLNGEPMGEMVEKVNLEFNNGKWLLLITYSEMMDQA